MKKRNSGPHSKLKSTKLMLASTKKETCGMSKGKHGLKSKTFGTSREKIGTYKEIYGVKKGRTGTRKEASGRENERNGNVVGTKTNNKSRKSFFNCSKHMQIW